MRRLVLAAGILVLAAARVPADVTDGAANGFDITVVATIQAPPHEIYRKLVHNGMNTWAATVNGVLTEQVKRLKNYVERGDPAAEPK